MFLAAFTSALPAYPQDVHEKSAWLLRDSWSTTPHTEHRCDVYAALTLSTRPGAFCSSRVTSRPQPWARMARFRPALARTFRPGASRVPLAERVMPLTFRSSTRITLNRTARSVEVCSIQSVRRSASRALKRAIAALVRARRFDPRWALASLRCNRTSRSACFGPGRAGPLVSPVESATATATPRSTPTT